MLTLVPLLLGPQNADPLASLRALVTSRRTLRVEVTSNGVRGTLIAAADGSVRVTSGAERLVHGVGGDWEYDTDARIFDHLPPAGPLLGGRVGTGRLNARAPSLLVPVLLARSGKGILDHTFSRKGSTYAFVLNGAQITLAFGKDRSLARLTIQSPNGGNEWLISGLRIVPDDPALFRGGIPTGYADALEPPFPDTLRIGSPLTDRFRNRAPAGAKTWVLAILERGSAPSDGARRWLTERLTKRFPSVILDDVSEADRRTIAVVDAPRYLLVGAGGKVLGVWAGYAESEERRIEEEMTATSEENEE